MTPLSSASQFDSEVLQSPRPVLVDVYADWCPPCRALSPVIDDLAASSGDRFDVVKLNSDELPEIAGRYGVTALPTVLIFVDGEVVETSVGVQSKAHYLNRLEAHGKVRT